MDADTGQLKWHFQFTPHDLHDWDSTQVPVLADLTINGTPRKTMLFANRNGFFYVLDRTNGRMILAKPFISQNWAKEISPEGRPILNPGTNPSEEGSTKVCPESGRRHQLLFAVVRPDATAVFRERTRDVRHLLHLQRAVPEGGTVPIRRDDTDT